MFLAQAGRDEGEKAEELTKLALEAADVSSQQFGEVHDWFGVATVKRSLARILRRRKDFDVARKLFIESAELYRYANANVEAEQTSAEADTVESSPGIPWYVWIAPILFGLFSLFFLVIVIAEL